MIAQENAASHCPAGGAHNPKIHNPTYPETAGKSNPKVDISEALGSLRFMVENLDLAAHEAAIAADCICEKNLIAGHYHVGRFAAHARAAYSAFREILGAPSDGGAP